MFQLDGVSVCKLTDLHWPKPKIISMPVIDACHKTDERYCTCSKMKLQMRNYCALVIINVQLSKPELVCEYHQQLYLCAAEWLISYTKSHVFPCLQVRYCVCLCRMLEESVSGSQGEAHGERSAGRKEVTADERPALHCKSTASSHLVNTLNWNTPPCHSQCFLSLHSRCHSALLSWMQTDSLKQLVYSVPCHFICSLAYLFYSNDEAKASDTSPRSQSPLVNTCT